MYQCYYFSTCFNNNLFSIYSVGFVDIAIGFDCVPFNIERKSSPHRMVSIISLHFLLSTSFSTSLCVVSKSQDIDVVDRYSALAISLTTPIVGVAIPEIAIGDVAIPEIVGVVLPGVAYEAVVLGSLGTLKIPPDPAEASAVVTLVKMRRFSCSNNHQTPQP